MIRLTEALRASMRERGVECLLPVGADISPAAVFEPPCSIKWMQIINAFDLGAFSYAVSGFFSNVSIGRYTSIGENVQIGRSNHSLAAVSTSPFFTLNEPMFQLGSGFSAAEPYHRFSAGQRHFTGETLPGLIRIGNDVWIGHGAYIRPGVTIGDGAVIGGMSVVMKDVPAYGVVAGNPATLKRIRLPPREVAALTELAWWRFAPWQLDGIDFGHPAEAIELIRTLVWGGIAPYAPEKVVLHATTPPPGEPA